MKLFIPPPIIAIICAGLMALIARYVPEFMYVTSWQTYAAGLICLVGILIDLASIRLFVKQRTTISPLSPNKTSELVVSDIYNYTRNPMYLGMAIILTGFGVWLGNFASFALIPCFVMYITRYQIMPEEEALLEKFGVDYADYCARVGRWI